MTITRSCLVLAAVLAGALAAASEEAPSPPVRVALALGGGGARGIAHVGALRALEEAGIPVDAIAANSMGAVVGGIFATGRSSHEIEGAVRSMDWASLFGGRPDRRTLPISRREDRYAALVGVSFDWKHVRFPAGLVAEHRVNRFLIQNLASASFTAGGDFDRLPIPFRAVATDLATGERVVLARGDLARAVRASMSIPLVFPPVDWGERRLVDGMVVDNLPVDVARSWKPAVLVAVDVGSPALEPSGYESALGVASQVNDLLMRRRNRDFSAQADVLVRPELGGHSATDYSGLDELIRAGYEATRAAIPAIREKLAAAGVTETAPRLQRPAGRPLEGEAIREVAVRGNLRLEDRFILRTFNIPVGPGYEMDKGLRAFDKVIASGLIERAWMEFEPAADGVAVVLRVTEAPPNRAEAAVGYSEWERTRAAIRLLEQNTLGLGEQIELLVGGSDAESLARLSLSGDRLLTGGLGYRLTGYASRDKPRFFDADGGEINRASFERAGAELALRGPLKRWLEIEAGLRLGQVRTRPQAGIDLKEADDSVRTAFASAAYDTLDDLQWPNEGERLAVIAEWSPAGLGPSHEFWKLDVQGRLGRTLGARTTLQLDARVGLSGRDLAAYDRYRLGGVELLPGYRHEELQGAQALAGAFSVRCRLLGELRLLARAGAGNVFARTRDVRLAGLRWGVAVGAIVPTRVGPVSAELAVHDGGGTLASVALGWN
ncbi:MAG: patatin-like phospholipase family protein [Betaproteobacteria bacterium]